MHGCARATLERLPPAPGDAAVAPATFRVSFGTTNGTFITEAHREWSPAAVDRFYHLVRRRIFRVVPGFVAQSA